ncbi:MAG: DNA recombination protein RmuC [Clostridia bacterium]|nr:DNA recombination protein RmuC [Clostridia bacterium]
MEIAIIILLAVLIICVMCILVLVIKNGSRTNDGARMFSEIVSENQRNIGTMQTERFTRMDGELKAMRASIDAHLAEIYKCMGDISSLSSGVNDLRRVLTNVKTRGILGEIPLGAI